MNDLIQICEELYGNVATVFHRFDEPEKVKQIFSGTYKNLAHIDFNDYHNGIYTTFNMESQRSEKGQNNMEKVYGSKVLKLAIKDMNKFMFMDFGQYRKYNRNANKETFIKEQLKKFGIDKYFRYDPENHVTFSKTVERNKLFNKVAGVIYHGKYDGDCALIYDNKAVFPISISNDNGKTWKPYREIMKQLPDRFDNIKKSYKERFDAYKKGFQPKADEKEKLCQKNEVPASVVRKAINFAMKRFRPRMDRSKFRSELGKIKPGSKIFYTLKRRNDDVSSDVIYRFYSNGKNIGEFKDLGSYPKMAMNADYIDKLDDQVLVAIIYIMKGKLPDLNKVDNKKDELRNIVKSINKSFRDSRFSIVDIDLSENTLEKYPRHFYVVLKPRNESGRVSLKSRAVFFKGNKLEFYNSHPFTYDDGDTVEGFIGEDGKQKLIKVLKEVQKAYVREFGIKKNADIFSAIFN